MLEGMKKLLSLACLACLLAARAHAGILSWDATGITATGELIRHYASLCQRYPSFGDKVGDGVFIIGDDRFHLDSKHYEDYLRMCQREKVDLALREHAQAMRQRELAADQNT